MHSCTRVKWTAPRIVTGDVALILNDGVGVHFGCIESIQNYKSSQALVCLKETCENRVSAQKKVFSPNFPNILVLRVRQPNVAQAISSTLNIWPSTSLSTSTGDRRLSGLEEIRRRGEMTWRFCMVLLSSPLWWIIMNYIYNAKYWRFLKLQLASQSQKPKGQNRSNPNRLRSHLPATRRRKRDTTFGLIILFWNVYLCSSKKTYTKKYELLKNMSLSWCVLVSGWLVYIYILA